MNNLNYSDKPKIYNNHSTIIYSFSNFVIKKNKFNNSNNKYYINEINILKKIKNKNICNLLDYEDYNSFFYMKLEKCDYNLRNYIENKSNSYDFEICIGIINGLKFLYENNIVHRDLKPENILIKDFTMSKICDFGLSKILDNNKQYMKTICGTPLYMAPEIIIDKTYNNKIDLWSLGIIFFEIFFHKYPYKGDTHNELLTNIISSSVTIPKNNIPFKIINLITILIQNKVEKRIEWFDLFNENYFEKDIELNFNDLFDCTNEDCDDFICSFEDITEPLERKHNNEIKIINTPNDNMFTIHRTLSDLELNNFNNKDKIDKTFK